MCVGGRRVKFTARVIHPSFALFAAFKHVEEGRGGSRT